MFIIYFNHFNHKWLLLLKYLLDPLAGHRSQLVPQPFAFIIEQQHPALVVVVVVPL
jgi:hypothetical protein